MKGEISKDLFRYLTDKIPGTIVNPVNPFSIDNPDCLFFSGSNLVALFIPSAQELQKPDILLRRLYVSKFIHCNELKAILVAINVAQAPLLENHWVVRSFDANMYLEKFSDLEAFSKDKIKARNIIDNKLKHLRFKRFWGITDFFGKYSQTSAPFFNFKEGNKIRCQSWSNPNHLIQQNSFSKEGNMLLASKRASKSSFRSYYEPLFTNTLLYEFHWDDGNLRENKEAKYQFRFLNVENIFKLLENPLHFNSLAFMGFVPGLLPENFHLQAYEKEFLVFMDANHYF
ncbi:MAG: hypothetical protein J1D77_01310 [Muribaculaceae bacterium]|nr:hypothetical protein [Muribaculaceae bacterium]